MNMFVLWVALELTMLRSMAADDTYSTCTIGTCAARLSSQITCKLYMAESTIPGAGLGIFSGVARSPGDVLWPGDVMLPMVDVQYHQRVFRDPLHRLLLEQASNPLLDYVWFGSELNMEYETSYPYSYPEYITTLAPGLDAATNCQLGLINVEKCEAPTAYRTFPGPHRGSMTPYHQCETFATHAIPAGGELFKFYGDYWFESRPNLFGHYFPLSGDYTYALDFLINAFEGTLVPEVQEQRQDEDDEWKWDLWDFITRLPLESRTLNALPKSRRDYELVLEHESLRVLSQPQATRALEDLEQNGRCIDQLYVNESAIAGHGVFAKHAMSAGSGVASTPVLFFPHSAPYFEMYEGNWFEKDDIPNVRRRENFQIAYNYCWHNPEYSSLVLCPYGAHVNYINHAPTSGNKRTANVRLQWAPHGSMGHDDRYLYHSPKVMYFRASPPLYLDFVALRDIAPDEEILYDYGSAWESAWAAHVAQFPSADDDGGENNYQSARDWNTQNPDAVLRTIDEEPYPDHFQLYCLIPPYMDRNKSDDDSAYFEDIWNRARTPAKPCQIFQHFHGPKGGKYRVMYQDIPTQQSEGSRISELRDWEWTELMQWIPRPALRFIDRAYTTELWEPNAFRQPIALPEDIFPEAWKGVYLTLDDAVDTYGREQLQQDYEAFYGSEEEEEEEEDLD